MQHLTGKTALVTGASKGIGAAIAIMFATAGARVIVNYRQDEAAAADVVQDIRALGGEAIAVQADISRPPDVERLFAVGSEHFSAPDIVVNNAGLFHYGAIAAWQVEEMQRLLAVNIFGTLLVCQTAVRYFTQRGGCIINLSALASQESQSGDIALWAATKGAIDSLTQNLGRELGARNIRVNALAPGIIVTEGMLAAKTLNPQLKAQMLAAIPLGRFGLPEDVAKVALFLASEESAYISGDRVLVAGGC